MDMALAAAYGLAFAAAVFFWGRGTIRARKGDLVAGWCVLLAVCVITYVTAISSAVFSFIGLLIGGFGLATLILSPFASPNCPIVRSSRDAVGGGAIVIGLVLQLIL